MKHKPTIASAELDFLKKEIRELERAVKYYSNLSDEVAGYNILVDSQIIFLKRDLEQKKIGYDILRKLHDIIGTKIDIDGFFQSTLQLILTHLKMDRSVVVLKDRDSAFRVSYSLGYSKVEMKNQFSESLDLSELNNLDDPYILLNKASPRKDYHNSLCEQLLIPFMVGTPIKLANKIEGWLIAGREKEARPFYPPLMPNDLELFEVMGGFIKATMSNFQLYSNLKEANKKLANYNKRLEIKVEERTRDIEISRQELEEEKVRTDKLLLNILPIQIANELKEHGQSKARSYNDVTILFTDFVNFTNLAESMAPEELVTELDDCFTEFDLIIEKYNLEKIKTIGDAYMATGGMEGNPEKSCLNIVKAALEMQEFIKERSAQNKGSNRVFSMRVGINTGNVVAGIVGLKKFQYDIWGDTVNTAARLESAGEVGKVNISESTFSLVKNYDGFSFEHRGKVEAKGKGEIDMWFVKSDMKNNRLKS